MTRSELQVVCFGVARDPLQVFLAALCTYREARGETADVQFAQACSMVNRILNPSWYGHDIPTVVLKPWQYSSFNYNDPNNVVWPLGIKRPVTNLWGLYQNNMLWPFLKQALSEAEEIKDVEDPWYSCLNSFNNAARGVMPDTTQGAINYFDKSLDNNLPVWAKDGTFEHTVDIGRLRFWKPVPGVKQ